MRYPISKRQRGRAFTLVELLVVMGIIAILAAVVLGGIGSALRFARRTKANTAAVQIQTAVQNYFTEYGTYPIPAGDVPTPPAVATDDYFSGSDVTRWENLMYALCGNVNPYTGVATTGTVPNTRSIPYLSPVRSDLDKNGIVVNPFGSSATSTYFYMAVDSDYSGVVGDSTTTKIPDFTQFPTNYMGATLTKGTPGGVAVWCPCDQPLVGTVAKPSPANFWAHTY